MLGPAENFPVGSVEWAQRISNRLQVAFDTVSTTTVYHLARTVVEICKAQPRPWEVWPDGRPFGTPDDYCKAITGHPWKALVEIVREMGGEQMQFDFRNMEAELARAQAKYRKQGTRTDRHHANSMKLKQGSTQSAYLLRRLARDHKEILARYEAGEFKSVRAAAKTAGIIKPRRCRHCGHEL
jgi:hypothetical protein